VSGEVERLHVSSGSPWEPKVGIARALRVGGRVLVSGTAPIWPDGSCNPDSGAQARRCLEIILGALEEAGSGRGEVVRTRMFLTAEADAEAVAAAHAETFADVRPVSTMVIVSGFLDPRWKVEIEAEALRR
jgi:enamine deaminase RidA (YjgF/YER057c/UK114 family)